MDMAGGEASTDDGMRQKMMNPMRSTFHIEIPFTILFEQWNVQSTKDVLLSCLLLMLLSFFNESLKHVRSYIHSVISGIINKENQQYSAKDKSSISTVIQYTDGCHCVEMKPSLKGSPLLEPPPSCSRVRKLKTAKIPLHLINCLIYGLQMFIGFGLMLTAMSFHTGVIASIVTGAVLGKVVLAWPAGTKSTAKIEDEDGCH